MMALCRRFGGTISGVKKSIASPSEYCCFVPCQKVWRSIYGKQVLLFYGGRWEKGVLRVYSFRTPQEGVGRLLTVARQLKWHRSG